MGLTVIDGNIFTSGAQTLVNTVNCVGVMGAGIALECRLRYPDMYRQYLELCEAQSIRTGSLWIYKSSERWILNFPTKRHWKNPSKPEFLHEGLAKFMKTYEEKGIESVAFPLLGAQNGGLDRDESQALMEFYLLKCKVPVEIYRYDPSAPDDLFERFRELLLSMSPSEIASETGLRSNYVQGLLDAVRRPDICQLGRLATVRGIGEKTLERAFSFALGRLNSPSASVQQKLF